MSAKFIKATMLTLALTVASANVAAYAADAPKTKEDCAKAKGKWDEKAAKCTVKK